MGTLPSSRSTLDFIRSLPRDQQAMGYRCYVEAERRCCPERSMGFRVPTHRGECALCRRIAMLDGPSPSGLCIACSATFDLAEPPVSPIPKELILILLALAVATIAIVAQFAPG
jgi:hypothetical protein